MTDNTSHSPDFSDRQDALRAMAQPREGEGEFWNRQREAVYGPIVGQPIPRRRLSVQKILSYVPEILCGIGAVGLGVAAFFTKW